MLRQQLQAPFDVKQLLRQQGMSDNIPDVMAKALNLVVTGTRESVFALAKFIMLDRQHEPRRTEASGSGHAQPERPLALSGSCNKFTGHEASI